MIETNRVRFIYHKFKLNSNQKGTRQQQRNNMQSNLFPLRLINLGELVPVAIDLVERGRVFWQRWRWNRPGRYRWLLVRFVATVDAGRDRRRRTGVAGRSWHTTWNRSGARTGRLKVCHVGTRRRKDRFHRRNRRPGWLRWRRCTHIFIILLLANTL